MNIESMAQPELDALKADIAKREKVLADKPVLVTERMAHSLARALRRARDPDEREIVALWLRIELGIDAEAAL